jgi:hypothetical protein
VNRNKIRENELNRKSDGINKFPNMNRMLPSTKKANVWAMPCHAATLPRTLLPSQFQHQPEHI